MLRRLLQMLRREGPETGLRGAPVQPRLKVYSAQSGFIFHYYYEGMRETSTTIEYAFRVSWDRKNWSLSWVHVHRIGVEVWNREHGRTLSRQELYAVAKLALFEAFDSREEPAEILRPAEVVPTDISRHLGALGLD